MEMNDIMEKIKKGATKAIDEAEKFTGAAITKTGNLVNQTKLNYAINTNEGKIKDILKDIGQIVFEEYKEGSQFPENISEKLATIDVLYDEIDELKAKIADMKNTVVCSECSSYNSSDSDFCSKCGANLK